MVTILMTGLIDVLHAPVRRAGIDLPTGWITRETVSTIASTARETGSITGWIVVETGQTGAWIAVVIALKEGLIDALPVAVAK